MAFMAAIMGWTSSSRKSWDELPWMVSPASTTRVSAVRSCLMAVACWATLPLASALLAA